jgi:hypothetical protein
MPPEITFTHRELITLKRLAFWAAGSSLFPGSRMHPYVDTAQYFWDKLKEIRETPEADE